MRVCIDAGHGGGDPGATFQGLKEKDITLVVSTYLDEMLSPSVIDTCLTRPTDQFIGLAARSAFSDSMNADLFLSIHTNADPDDDTDPALEARGGEVWINPGSVKGRKFAEFIQHALLIEFPDEPFRGIKERGLYVLRHTLAPAALVEIAFIDNSESNRTLRLLSVQRKIAFALQRAILQYHDLVHEEDSDGSQVPEIA